MFLQIAEEGEIKKEKDDYSDLWTEKSLKDSKFWFLDTLTGEDALSEIKDDSSDVVPTPNVHQQVSIFCANSQILHL